MKINLLYFKTYSYFNPIGFGCLTRERRECEVYITKLEEQHGILEINDQADVNQRQSQINSQQKYKESKWSSITNFLQSAGKIFVGASSSAHGLNILGKRSARRVIVSDAAFRSVSCKY